LPASASVLLGMTTPYFAHSYFNHENSRPNQRFLLTVLLSFLSRFPSLDQYWSGPPLPFGCAEFLSRVVRLLVPPFVPLPPQLNARPRFCMMSRAPLNLPPASPPLTCNAYFLFPLGALSAFFFFFLHGLVPPLFKD